MSAIGEKQRAYFEALGKFVTDYASVERGLTLALKKLSGLSDKRAGILLYGVRSDAASKLIAKLLDAKSGGELDRKNFLNMASHFGHINDVRNSILHYGTDFADESEYITSNAIAVHDKAKIRSFRISTEILKAMSNDLFQMRATLLTLILPNWQNDEKLKSAIDAHILQPWQYKSVQPSSLKSAKQNSNAPKQAHRRAALKK